MNEITQKLKRYQKSYVPGEKRSPAYDNMIHQKQTLQENMKLLDELNREVPETLRLNKCEIKMVQNLAKVFNNNLKYLCRNCKKELIFLTLMFYFKKMDNPSILIKEHSYLLEKGLTENIYGLIIGRLAMYYMVHNPLKPIETTDYDHDLLIRNGGR